MGNLVKSLAATGLVVACALAQAQDTYLTEDQTKDLIRQVIQLIELHGDRTDKIQSTMLELTDAVNKLDERSRQQSEIGREMMELRNHQVMQLAEEIDRLQARIDVLEGASPSNSPESR